MNTFRIAIIMYQFLIFQIKHVYIEENIIRKIKLQIIDIIKHHHLVLW